MYNENVFHLQFFLILANASKFGMETVLKYLDLLAW